ncbi:MAG: hypothetical protein ABSF67_04650 [Roseiarcus sp.]
MLRPFLLSLILVGAGASSVGEARQPSDVATWRYQVSSILDAQHDEGGLIVSPAVGGYDQDYQRYEGQGRPASGTIAH